MKKLDFSIRLLERMIADQPVSLCALLRILDIRQGPKVRFSELKEFFDKLQGPGEEIK
jgi:hypothetical protein